MRFITRLVLGIVAMAATAYVYLQPADTGVVLAIDPLTVGLIGAGALGGLFGGGGQKQTTQLDPATQRYLEQFLRPGAQGFSGLLGGGITGEDVTFDPESFRAFMDPYQQEVIDAANADFDVARDRAGLSARQEAAMAGSARGSRGAVLQAQRESQIDRQRASTIAGLRSAGFEQANRFALGRAGFNVDRISGALSAGATGLGPGGAGTVTTGQHGGTLSRVLGGGVSGGLLGQGLRSPGSLNIPVPDVRLPASPYGLPHPDQVQAPPLFAPQF